MKRAERLAAHYIRAADLRAICLTSARGLSFIGITRDPAKKARDLKRRRARLNCVFWLPSSAAAGTLIRAVEAAFPGIQAGAVVRPAMVEAALPQLARDWSLALTEDRLVQERAAVVVKDIDNRVKAMQASGHLRGLNSDYRNARADASKRGVPFQSYGDYLERYKITMLYQIVGAMKKW